MVRVFHRNVHSRSAVEFHAFAPLEALPCMRVLNSIPLACPLPLTGSHCKLRPKTLKANSTVSSDGFYYEQVDLTMARYGVANGCSGEPEHYSTRFDGESNLYCVQVSGGRCTSGNPAIRCSYDKGHTWPFVDDARCSVWRVFEQKFALNEDLHRGSNLQVPTHTKRRMVLEHTIVLGLKPSMRVIQ
jgi:hypothetical protein